MKILLDTHVALWWYIDSKLLSKASREALEDINNTIFFSAASSWELNLKISIGKLKVPSEFFKQIMEDFIELPVRSHHANRLLKIDMLHRDPFDLMLIAQCIEDDLVLVTRDKEILQYPIQCLEA